MQRSSTDTYRLVAYGLAITGLVAFGVSVAAYFVELWLVHGQELSTASLDWGTFGDFVGGFAGTLIALCTLVALAVTLRLQSLELQETRAEMGKQTSAAQEQIKEMRDIEARRLRPLIKSDWVVVGNTLQWELRNVGLGPGIVDRVSIVVAEGFVGEHEAADTAGAAPMWRVALQRALGDIYPGDSHLQFTAWTDSTRILAIGERQIMLMIHFVYTEQLSHAFGTIRLQGLEALVHYRSISGEQWSTLTQLM